MKKSCITVIFLLILCQQAPAYVTEGVLITAVAKNAGSKDASLLAREVAVTIEDALVDEFPCLKVTTQAALIQQLDDLRHEALLGPGGWQWLNSASADQLDSLDQYTSYEETTAFNKKIDDKLAKLAEAAGAKYLVRVETISDKNLSSIRITALNMKTVETCYRDAQMFNSIAAALAGSKGVAEKLVEGFTEYLSDQKGGNGEICPFTGRIDVYREEKVDRKDLVIRPNHCSGVDVTDSTTDTVTSLVREVWSLERFGNPDARGRLEAQITQQTVHEEIENCHECGGKKGRRVRTRKTTVAGEISGLSEESKGESTNKDATIRLEFKEDGTYNIIVKASSVTGKKTETVTESDHGPCGNSDNSAPPGILPLTLNFDYLFGPFAGTPRDDKLAGRKEVKLPNADGSSETILRIDFELDGFKHK